MTYLYSIQKSQLDSFKAHAVALADTLKALDPAASPIKGRKRVDLLAQACGYKGHTDLIYRASGGSAREALELFSPRYGREVARAYASMSDLRPELVLAAVVKAGEVLYTAANETEFHWRVKDILTLPEESQKLIFPPIKLPDSMKHIGRVLDSMPKIPLDSPIFQIGRLMREQQSGIFDLVNQSRGIWNSEVMKSLESINASTSALRHAIGNNPVLEQMRLLQESPGMKALREASEKWDKMFPASLRKLNFGKPPKG
jgi:hypothetical protein